MSTILSEVKGFTPVIDVMVKDVGLIEAVIYGVVWRYCQLSDNVCAASLEKIGERAGVTGKTAQRHIKELCNNGYLIDTTPTLRNKPHIYKDAGKARISGLIEAGVTESSASMGGRTESPSHQDRESDLGRTESPLKIHDTKEIHADKQDGRAWFISLANLCEVDLAVATKRQAQQVGQSSKLLKEKAGATPEQIVEFGKWWYANDWRGKQDQAPTPAQVREAWGKFKKSTSKARVRIRV